MTRKEKDEIKGSLKRECSFLLQVAQLFKEDENMPEESKDQSKIIFDGLMKIREHLAQELNAIDDVTED